MNLDLLLSDLKRQTVVNQPATPRGLPQEKKLEDLVIHQNPGIPYP